MSAFKSDALPRAQRPIQRDYVDASAGARNDAVVLDNILEPDASLVIAHDPRDQACEPIRALRTELLLRREAADTADVFALLSPCPGEGRSRLAAELAIAFAQTGRPTLLVDADLRNPRQHVLFGTEQRKGLTQALGVGVHPTLYGVRGLPRLSVLPAGPAAANPAELLAGDRFGSLVEDWRSAYSVVVIDTPAVGVYSDALTVATLVGRVIALSRAHRTPFRDMQDMLRRVAVTRAQVLGAVISHF